MKRWRIDHNDFVWIVLEVAPQRLHFFGAGMLTLLHLDLVILTQFPRELAVDQEISIIIKVRSYPALA